jgi:hypothetical protein
MTRTKKSSIVSNIGPLLLIAALALTGLPSVETVSAQTAGFRFNSPQVAAVSAVDTDTAFVIRYVGGVAGTNTIAYSAPNLNFVVGGVADAGITGCGATPGSLDVSNAACNSFLEILNIVNNSANWRMALVDVLGSDVSTSNIVTLGATDANPIAGVPVLWKSSASFQQGRALVACRTYDCLSYGGGKNVFATNPYRGYVGAVKFINIATTYASGTSTIKVYSVKPGGVQGAQFETVKTLYSVAGGATTVAKVLGPPDLGSDGLFGDKDSKIIVRVENSAALSAPAINLYSNLFNY